jgi:hypothetical protein
VLFAPCRAFVYSPIRNNGFLLVFDWRKMPGVKVLLKQPSLKFIDMVLKFVNRIILFIAVGARHGDRLSKR